VIILVAVGASDRQPTLERAAELAMASQAAVVVLHVRERHYARGVVWDEPAPANAAELLNESIYDLRRRNIAARGAVRLAPAGRVAEAIVRAAIDFRADLIVVGRSPEWALIRFMTANISQRVVNLAPLPVLVIPRGRGVLSKSKTEARRCEEGGYVGPHP
jgi:nucleotide-binding universal stress UspA family protein